MGARMRSTQIEGVLSRGSDNCRGLWLMAKRGRVFCSHTHKSVTSEMPFIPDPGDPMSSIVLGGYLHSCTHELPPYTYAHIPENKNKP